MALYHFFILTPRHKRPLPGGPERGEVIWERLVIVIEYLCSVISSFFSEFLHRQPAVLEEALR